MSNLQEFVTEFNKVPLSWAGSTSRMNYLNLGDALSPVMVALCSGLDIERIPFSSRTPRLAAVGTIGQGIKGGSVHFWGTGCSDVIRKGGVSEPYRPPKDTRITIHATRGPISENLLSGGKGGPGIYGDPVWLLPRFYNPKPEKRWKLGVIVHLSELTDREYEAHVNPQLLRYEIPPSFAGDIRLISTVTEISMRGIKERLDEILSCERIVSTSLHGMVFAESYSIPCLYFGSSDGAAGVMEAELASSSIDLRVRDLYGGLGLSHLSIFNQRKNVQTNWEDVISAIDRVWEEKKLNEDALLGAFPFPLNPVSAPDKGSIFDLPLLQHLKLQHDVDALQKSDKSRSQPAPG